MTMGTRVAVMKRGILQQVDTPQFIYDNPANLFVAGFIGSPPMNLCEVGLSSDNGVTAHVGDQRLLIDESLVAKRPGLADAARAGRKVVLGIRPENMEDAALAGGPADGRTLKAKVDITEALGSEVMVHFGVDVPQVFSDGAKKGDDDEESLGRIGSDTGSTFVASFNARTSVRPGEMVDVLVDTRYVHFFEIESGARL